MKNLLIGKQIGKYLLQELLGEGGMGQIYKARHPTLERDVALKLIHLYRVSDSTVVDRFRREARVVAALRHPGIVQVYDFDIDAKHDIFYMVMEFVQGESLAHRLVSIDAQGGRLPLAEALRLMRLITEAVAYAHNQGVIHCDLKPDNVMLNRDDQPILTDFGISKFVSGERLTSTSDILGTPHYMSPEQGTGRWKIDARTDVYSLGVMLYELTAGQLPFSGDTSMSIMFKHINDQPPSPRTINPGIPESVEQIIQKAMAKDPAWRYPSAQEMLAALEALSPTQAIQPVDTEPASLFICYKPHAEPDESIAAHLYQMLSSRGHQVFIDPIYPTGETWVEQVDRQIKASDFFIVLLSKAAAESEMIQIEVNQAYDYYMLHEKPHLLSVRIASEGLLPYAIPAFLEPLHYVDWQSEADNAHVVEEILSAIAGQLPPSSTAPAGQTAKETSVLSEDGRLVAGDETSQPPLPAFDPRFLQKLAVPGGAVKLRDKLYVERAVDAELKEQMVSWGSTVTIRAPRQSGKTSLLMRGIHYARQQQANVVFLDFQSFGSSQLAAPDLFLRELAVSICDELDLDETAVEEAWEGSRSPFKKLTRFMEQAVLPAFEEPIILAMDEADSLLRTDFYQDFFGLLRSWHNRRASHEEWEILNLVLVISTEPYLLIDDIHQSPFNVGLHLGLTDFDENQVRDLNARHGSPVAERDLPALLALLNGHPFLTRLALYKIVTEGMSWADLRQQAPTDEGLFGDHLRHQYWTIYDKPDLKNALKEIILTKCCPDERSLFRLLRAGLIKGSGDVYTCRCDLYRLYFGEKLF
ncbi:MAG: protein kinase [Anaerolineales bacterium]|nr:protein kinase [Anaerolineales bacterium]